MLTLRRLLIFALLATAVAILLDRLANSMLVQADETFDRNAMLRSIVENVILPGQAAFINSTIQLNMAAERFYDDPNSDNLAALHQAWRQTSDAWDKIAIFNMDLRLTSYHNQIYKPPANYEFIHDILTGDDELSEAYVNGIGSTSKGLDAIEYLAFAPDKTPAEIIDIFADSRRRQFTLALAQNIQRKASEINDYWSPDGRDFAKRFVKADQAGGNIQGSINMLVNKIFVQLETDLQMWLGRPAGIALDGDARPDLVESPHSQHSLQHIANRLIGLQNIFNGGDALGFDDYLDFIGAEYNDQALSQAINQQFAHVIASINAIDQPLSVAVVESPATVARLYEDMRQLLIPIRVDMKSHLSILVTLSDRDGDQ